jgi:hypothetical protein
MINTLDLDEKKLSELELRGALHSMIEKIESNKLVHYFQFFKESMSDIETEDWLLELPKEVQDRILSAKNTAKNHPELMKPHSEVRKKYEKFLN